MFEILNCFGLISEIFETKGVSIWIYFFGLISEIFMQQFMFIIIIIIHDISRRYNTLLILLIFVNENRFHRTRVMISDLT